MWAEDPGLPRVFLETFSQQLEYKFQDISMTLQNSHTSISFKKKLMPPTLMLNLRLCMMEFNVSSRELLWPTLMKLFGVPGM